MTIKDYLKTLNKKEIIALEPNIRLRSFNGNIELLHFLGTVEEVLNLDPPHMQAEYEGCVPTCVVNGNEGKYIVYNDIRKAEPITIETTRDSNGMEIERINLDNWDEIKLPIGMSF